MKIAVASDGVGISPHFGRCACFLVFQVDNGQVVGKESRPNTYTAFALGQCDHGHNHGHGPIVNALRDCTLVLCGGIGWHAAEELKQYGIQVSVVGENISPDEAVRRYLVGELPEGGDFCRCHD